MERNSINLASDVLDTPSFFWENDEWDPVYSMLCQYLEHSKRIDVLNRRLDCVHELLDVLQSQTENRHASRLEWIVIWLITLGRSYSIPEAFTSSVISVKAL